MDTHDLLRPLKYLWASLALQMVVNADFVCFFLYALIGSSGLGIYVFLGCVYAYAWTLTHHFTRQSRIYSGRANKYMQQQQQCYCREKKGVQHKIKAILGQFSTDHHVFMHISKHFDDSLNTRLHIHHFVSSSLHNFRWNNFYVAHISHCVRAENVGRATKPTTLRWA